MVFTYPSHCEHTNTVHVLSVTKLGGQKGPTCIKTVVQHIHCSICIVVIIDTHVYICLKSIINKCTFCSLLSSICDLSITAAGVLRKSQLMYVIN